MVYDDFDGGELVGPLASTVTEDKHARAGLEIAQGVSVGVDSVVWDDVAVVVERGHSGWGFTSVGVDAVPEGRVVRGSFKQHTRAYLLQIVTNG